MRRNPIFSGARDGGTSPACAVAASASVLIPPTRNVLPPLGVMFQGADIPVVAPAPEETP